MSQQKFSSDKDISRYDLERIQGIATGRSRLITQGDSLPDYQWMRHKVTAIVTPVDRIIFANLYGIVSALFSCVANHHTGKGRL